jgi:hypothetical protein
MSNFNVLDTPSCVTFTGEPNPIVVQNTGSQVVWLNETNTPSYTVDGFSLSPGASKEWAANTPLWIRCDPSFGSTVVTGGTAGASFSPSPLNAPQYLFSNIGATLLSTLGPLTGSGRGDQWTSAGSTSYSQVIPCSDYNSLTITASETGPGGSNYQMRDFYILWFTKANDGTFSVVDFQNLKWYAIGDPANVDPQVKARIPVHGTHFRMSVGPATYPNGSDINRLTLLVVGDSRTLDMPVVKNSAYYWQQQELTTIGPFVDTDLSVDNKFAGTASFPVGSTFYSFTTISGKCKFYCRVSTSAALVQGTRVQLTDRFSNDPSYSVGFQGGIGVVGIQSETQEIFLSKSPYRMQVVNNQAVATTFFISITPEEW